MGPILERRTAKDRLVVSVPGEGGKVEMVASETFVQCDNLIKIYKIADLEVVALQGLNLQMAQGEMAALIGPSGVGKSTLLNVLGGLDTPSAGRVQVGEWDLLRMKERDRVRYKRQTVGFVWQQPARNLLPYLTARENVDLPQEHNGIGMSERRKRSMELLDVVGLADRAAFRPEQLSGGQQQRAALAVALANNPALLLGDELTGQVDSEAAMRVLDALGAINHAFGTTVVLVTHDPLVASRVDRVITVRDGRTSTEVRRQAGQDGSPKEEEWVIVDPVGRLQLPRTHLDALRMREWVRVHLEPDHVSIWPWQGDGGSGAVTEPGLPLTDVSAFSGERTGVAVRTDDLSRAFDLAGGQVRALREVSLSIPGGCFAAIKGPSGSGKTTLLNLVAGLDEPTAGSVHLGDRVLVGLGPQETILLRRQEIGFVFQTFALLPSLTVEENVQVPLRLLRTDVQKRRTLVDEVLNLVGLADRARHRIYELSGGEQQRVSLARAMVKGPSLILADEPTGQLDSLTGRGIIKLLKEIASQTGVTVVVASHDPNVHEAADMVLELQDGRLVG